ncbi:hypothetical protein APHAL10511_007210 [Amanita phalloides]|nr:hypothetical protein APHAL10511_007210 [Amanita phalloides]
MADLPPILAALLDPRTQKRAEQNLSTLSSQPGFLSHLLRLVLDASQPTTVRLSGSVYLKNIAKSRWEEEDPPLAEQDKATLRRKLVPAMLALSKSSDAPVRVQIAEAVSLIAELDFPARWPDLIDQLVTSLSTTDYEVNLGVLQTAHSIFRPWRSQVRSDKLYSEINFVLSKFMAHFLQLFRQTSSLLLTAPSPNPPSTLPKENYVLLARNMVLLVDIFYDFTCQDLPPAIEDSYDEFFGSSPGWFQAFLVWEPNQLRDDADETSPSLPAQIKTGILEVAELFVKLYPDQLQGSKAVEMLVQRVWSLVGSNKLPNTPDDILVSQALRFISTAIRSGQHKALFASKPTITSLVQHVVVPNVSLRAHELELFEDDPLEYIRLDLSLPLSGSGAGGADITTRRQAAADVLQALVGSGYEIDTTEIVGKWINQGLQIYNEDKSLDGEGWKAKDSAIYLLNAVATRGATVKLGVTSVNALIDVVKFFSDHVLQDLQAAPGTVHPILQIDAIRFLYTFRNQLTKPQLLSVLPLLSQHLACDNYVICTYAAITIDRILSMRQGNALLFSQADVHDSAPKLVDILLKKIEATGSPDKMAENDHLTKCVMRVIITARQSLTPVYENILGRLVGILGIISKNPMNPNFDHYLFESISALMRFVVAGSPKALAAFEQALFLPFTVILQQDIEQYVPYVFQILAQMLELHEPSELPSEYSSLLHVLLTPAVWQQKGSIPGLVKLLRAFLARDSARMMAAGQVAGVLAVIQQRLIPSKMNDVWGFELLQAVTIYVKPGDLAQYMKAIIMTLLTRMQSSKTDSYVYLFARFVLLTMAVNVEGLSPDYIIQIFEDIQPRLWSQILSNFINPQISKMPHKDRKLAAVGAIRMLTESKFMLQEPAILSWPATFTSVAKLFSEPQYLGRPDKESDDPYAGLTEIDYEEQTAGYQTAYSRLAASETKEVDYVRHIRNPQEFLSQQLAQFSKAHGSDNIKGLLSAADHDAKYILYFLRDWCDKKKSDTWSSHTTMATTQAISVVVPCLPPSYTKPSNFIKSSLPHPVGHRTLIPAGSAYLNYIRLSLHHNYSIDALDNQLQAEQQRRLAISNETATGEDDLGVGDEPETDELLSLDPKEWKKHDYYAVLGLSHFRHKATQEQIKIAHRKKVLKHHPDKKVSTVTQNTYTYLGIHQNTNDDAFFKCIQKAYEVLTNPEKRRQFDSVDPALLELEEDIPTASEFKAKGLNFYKTLTSIFESYSHFSRIQPVPGLGDTNSTKEDVETFYDFWYNFDSWRSFEWLDKEINEGSDSRDDKRYTEKKNKAERTRRKKEDTAKLRSLVDLTLSLDPRIKRIKQQEKDAREAKKRGMTGSGTTTPRKTKAEEEAEKKRRDEEAQKKEEAEKVARAEAKKQKQAAANAAKKARRAARAVEEVTVNGDAT